MTSRCQGKTVSGKPCRNRARSGSDYCRVHTPPPEPAAPSPPSSTEVSKSWKTVREWSAVALAACALVISLVGFLEGRRNVEKDRQIEATRLLDQAWDLLGGKPGTEVISNYVEDPQEQEKARRLIWEALEIAPEFPLAHRRQGSYFQAKGHLREAEACYLRALEMDPDDVKTYNNLGNVLYIQGNSEEAEERLRQALAIDPDLASVHTNLGNILYYKGQLEEAEASYRRALEIDPDYVGARNNLGITLYSQGRLEEAEASLRQALEIADYDWVRHNLSSVARSSQGSVKAPLWTADNVSHHPYNPSFLFFTEWPYHSPREEPAP